MDPIIIKDDIFLISTDRTSYLFRVNQYKHLEHIHYGKRVTVNDADALSYKHYVSYGTTVLYDEEDPTYSLDHIPTEFGTYGRGDFHEASIEVEVKGSPVTEFLFDSCEVVDGDVPMEGLPSSYGAEKTLVIHLKDSVAKLSLDLYYAVYPKEDVIARRAVLTNHHNEDITLHKLMSYTFDLFDRDLVLMDLHGAWDREAHIVSHPVLPGTMTNSSRMGFSGAKNNPAFLLRRKDTTEHHGDAWGFNLVYTGNHYSSVSYDEYGFTRVMGGFSPERFHKTLASGESFEAPEAVLTYSDEGMNGMSQHFHGFINEHIIRSDWKKKERPVKINSWEAFAFDFKRDSLVKLAGTGKKLGMELFVLDDGWFGRRSDDTKGLGDYDCNTKKIPGGIKALSKDIHNLGMKFGIWVEPEAVSVDSALYERHPNWVLNVKGRKDLFGRHELLLDLTKKAVRDYIVDNVSKLIDDNDVDYVKWDMNRMMDGVNGVYDYEYIKGLYEVLGRIFYPRPHVLLESCASGGNRFDLGILCYSPQIWSSDDTDPIERVDIQKGLSYFYPLSTMGAHVSASPHSQTLRKTPLETRFAVAAHGCLGYELDLSLLSPLERTEIKNQITYYKEHRKTFQYGTFYRVYNDDREEVFEVKGDEEAIVTKVRRLVHAATELDKLYVYGLSEEEDYTVTSRDYTHNIEAFGQLINHTLPVKVNANGILVKEVGKRKGMEAAKQEYHASGNALSQGIPLSNLFLGTGYNKDLRLPPDFGSDMYLIKEKKDESGQKE